MPKQASTEDAKIIMLLYDLRREAEMRKAPATGMGDGGRRTRMTSCRL
jgi:hypothetical protein